MQLNPANTEERYAAIPQDLRALEHWLCWKYHLSPFGKTKVPYNPRTGLYASVDDPSTWVTFAEACAAAVHYEGIGFVFSKSAGYVGIDFDNVYERKEAGKATVTLVPGDIDYDRATALKAVHDNLIAHSSGYVERSPSGNGVHVIVKASVARGVKSPAAKIEMYDDKRFFTMTGDVISDRPAFMAQEMVDYIYKEVVKVKDVVLTEPNDGQEVEDDATVYNRAAFASNADKFLELWQGQWTHHYQSQSEADQALINIIGFYTDNFAQIVRLFRMSALARRDKAKRDNYVLPMVRKSQDRKPIPLDTRIKVSQDFERLLREQAARDAGSATVAVAAVVEAQEEAAGTVASQPAATHVAEAGRGITAPPAPSPRKGWQPPPSSRSWVDNPPPGLMCDIASFIYGQARLPVPEMALAASLGFLGGMAGRAFNYDGAGLNVYLTLLARTGRGKEAMSSGIDKLVAAMRMTAPAANRIIGPATISSGQSLLPFLQHHSNSFVSILSEFDKMLKALASPNRSSAIDALEGNLLKLYSKSGNGDTFGQTIYADRAKNTDTLYAPSLTLLGECTITHIKETVTEGMVSSGLLPRFVNIVYEGDRVDDNENAVHIPPDHLTKRLTSLFNVCMQLNQINRVMPVTVSDEAKAYLANVNAFCIKKLNAKTEANFDDLWNRTHLNVRKIAALAAIKPDSSGMAWNAHIELSHAEWAAQIVFGSANWWIKAFNKAEIGDQTNDMAQLRDLRRVIAKFLTLPAKTHTTYKATPLMVTDKIVPHRYIIMQLACMKSFKFDRRGATVAIKNAIATLIQNEEVIDMLKLSRNEYFNRYATNQAAYKIVSLHDDDGEP